MNKQKNRTITAIVLSLGLLLLSSCEAKTFPRSNAFYINDKADALLSSTEYLIYSTSKNLYEKDSQKQTFKNEKINGAQVVVATYLGEPGSIDTTKVFNDWAIGANDMGMLFMLYFAPNPDDKYFPTYLGMTREIGSKMAGYISMMQLELIFQETWENNMFLTVHRDDYDYKLAFFYTAVIEEIYIRVYNSTIYQSDLAMDDYDYNQYDSYYNYLPKGEEISFTIKWWVWLILGLLGLVLLGTGSWWSILIFTGSASKGGGGHSKGYKYTR